MAFSTITYEADGVADTFAVPFDYIIKDHVFVELIPADLSPPTVYDISTLTWTTDTDVQLPVTPADGDSVRVYRRTSPDELVVVFQSPSELASEDLNLALLSLLYLTQEALDDAAGEQAVLDGVIAYLTAAEAAATAAEASATAAGISETAAEGHATDAEAAKDAAELAQVAAELAETNAETAETNAEAAEAAAEGFRDEAEAFRDEAEVLVAEGFIGFLQPGARLSPTPDESLKLTSLTPNTTTIYYLPHVHSLIPLFNGVGYILRDIGQNGLSQLLSDATKSPAAAVANSVYDMFLWLDGDTPRCTRGAVWPSVGSRDAPGASEISLVNGRWVNAQDITNGPLAGRGLLVGTIWTHPTASPAEVEWNPTPSVSQQTARLGIWNMYNRHVVGVRQFDATVTPFEYTTEAWTNYNEEEDNLIAYVVGLAQDRVPSSFVAAVDRGRVGISNDGVSVTDYMMERGSAAVFADLQVVGMFPTKEGVNSIFSMQYGHADADFGAADRTAYLLAGITC